MPPKKSPSVTSFGKLSEMTVVNLKKLAKQRNVSLTGITKKADIIKALSSKSKPKKTEKEKLKKVVQKSKKSSNKPKMSSEKEWFIVSQIGDGYTAYTMLDGPFASKEAALYYIFNKKSARRGATLSDSKGLASDVISDFVRLNRVDPGKEDYCPYWILSTRDLQQWKDPEVSFDQFKKMITTEKEKHKKEKKESKTRMKKREKEAEELYSDDDY